MAEHANPVLDLNELSAGIPALTPGLAQVHAECAALCLEDQGHAETVELLVSGTECDRFDLIRMTVTNNMRRAHADEQRATELGACGVAFLLAPVITGLTAIQQAAKGGGFDYWLGPSNQPLDILVFQNSARLEVSGIRNGSASQVRTQTRAKLRQSSPSDSSNYPRTQL